MPGDAELLSGAPTISSSILTTIIDKLKKQVNQYFKITSSFEGGILLYQVFAEPSNILIGIGTLPRVAPKTQEAFAASVESYAGYVKQVVLSERVSSEKLNYLPTVFRKEAFLLVSPGEKHAGKAIFEVSVRAESVDETSAPIVLMDEEGVPMATGALSIYVPN